MYCPACGSSFPDDPTRDHCPTCNAPLPAAASPGGGGAYPPGSPAGIPWESRATLGFFPALFASLRRCLFEPAAFYEAMPKRENLGSALGYAVILGWIGIIGGVFWGIALEGFQLALLQQLGIEAPENQMSPQIQLMIQLGFAVLAPLFILIGLFIWSGILHLCLLLVGGAKEGFETTVRVYSYALGSTSPFQWLPICGGLIGWVWSLVLQIIGLSRAHGISGGRAAVAVLLPLALCCLCVGGGILLFAGTMASLFGGGGSW
jgi:hypothetical protein